MAASSTGTSPTSRNSSSCGPTPLRAAEEGGHVRFRNLCHEGAAVSVRTEGQKHVVAADDQAGAAFHAYRQKVERRRNPAREIRRHPHEGVLEHIVTGEHR